MSCLTISNTSNIIFFYIYCIDRIWEYSSYTRNREFENFIANRYSDKLFLFLLTKIQLIYFCSFKYLIVASICLISYKKLFAFWSIKSTRNCSIGSDRSQESVLLKRLKIAKLIKLQYMHSIFYDSVFWNARYASTTIRRHRQEKISWSIVFARQLTESIFTFFATL